MARVTLRTVADVVGVSRATVSNAFSRPDQLSAELRERILRTADDLGYAGPDPTARRLARGSTGAIGVVLSDPLRYAFTDEVLTGFLGAVADELAPTGLALTLLPPDEQGGAAHARDVPMDGALVCSLDVDSEPVMRLRKRGVPIVLVDQTPVAGLPSVRVDDRGGAGSGAEHLLELGHTRIGLLTVGLGPEPALVPRPRAVPVTGHPAAQRLLGWLDALAGAGVEPVVASQPAAYARATATARLLLDVSSPPTAVLCFSDAMAHDLTTCAGDLGLSVPDDLAVVGFDDSPLARRMRPALTTVRQDVAAKGRAAAAALRAAVAAARDGQPWQPEPALLPTELVVRDSTAPRRADRT